MPTRNVHLTEHFDAFIADGIASGQFSNASEIVREGLRLLEQRQAEEKAKIEHLRSAVQVGIDALERGDYLEFASIDDFEEYIDATGKEVSAELAASRSRG